MPRVLSNPELFGVLSETAFRAECQHILSTLKSELFEEKRATIDTSKQILVDMKDIEEGMVKVGRWLEDREIASQWNELKNVIEDRISLGKSEQVEYMARQIEKLLSQLTGSMNIGDMSDGRNEVISADTFAELIDSEQLKSQFLSSIRTTTSFSSMRGGVKSLKRPTKKKKNGGDGDNEDGNKLENFVAALIKASLDLDNSKDMANLSDIRNGLSRRHFYASPESFLACLRMNTKQSCEDLVQHCGTLKSLAAGSSAYRVPHRSLRSLALNLKNTGAMLASSSSLTSDTFRSEVVELLVASLSSLLGYYTLFSRMGMPDEIAEPTLAELEMLIEGALETCKCDEPAFLAILVDAMITGTGDSADPGASAWKHSRLADISDKLRPLLESDGMPHPWKVYPRARQGVEEEEKEKEVAQLVVDPRGACLTRLTANCIATALVLDGSGEEDTIMRNLMKHLARLNEVIPSFARNVLFLAASICSQQHSTESEHGTERGFGAQSARLSSPVDKLRALALNLKIDVTQMSAPDAALRYRDPSGQEPVSDGVENYRQMLATARAREGVIRGDEHERGEPAQSRSIGDDGRETQGYEYGRPNVQLLNLLSAHPSVCSAQSRWEQAHIMNRLLYPRPNATDGNSDSSSCHGTGAGDSNAYRRDIDADLRAQVSTFLARRSVLHYTGTTGSTATSSSPGTFAQHRAYSVAPNGGGDLLFTPTERSLGFDVGSEARPAVLHHLRATSCLQLDLMHRAVVDSEVLVSVSTHEAGKMGRTGAKNESSLFFDGVLIPNLAALTYYHLHLGQATRGELSSSGDRYPSLPLLPQLWSEKRHMLVSSALQDALRYYLRLLATPGLSASASESALLLRYVAVALDLISCIATNDSDEDCCSALVGAVIDTTVFSQCLETLLSGACVRGSDSAQNVGVLAEALALCLVEIVKTFWTIPDDHDRDGARASQFGQQEELLLEKLSPSRLLRILPLIALCSVAVDMEVVPETTSTKRLQSVVAEVMWVLWEKLPMSGKNVTVTVQAVPMVVVQFDAESDEGTPSRQGQGNGLLLPLRASMREARRGASRYLILPAEPIEALLRQRNQLHGGGAAALSSPEGTTRRGFVPGFLPSLQETKAALCLEDVVRDAPVVYLAKEGIRRILPSGAGTHALEEGHGRLRVVSLVLFNHYSKRVPAGAESPLICFLRDLAGIGRPGSTDHECEVYQPALQHLTPVQISAMVGLTADLSQRLLSRFHSVDVFSKAQGGSLCMWWGDDIPPLLLDLLVASERAFGAIEEEAYLPLLQVWCLLYSASRIDRHVHQPQRQLAHDSREMAGREENQQESGRTAGFEHGYAPREEDAKDEGERNAAMKKRERAERSLLACLRHFGVWQRHVSQARGQTFTEQTWQSDVNFVSASLGGWSVLPEDFPSARHGRGVGVTGRRALGQVAVGDSLVSSTTKEGNSPEGSVVAEMEDSIAERSPEAPASPRHGTQGSRRGHHTTPPSASTPGSGIRLGAIIRSSSRSAKRKARDSADSSRTWRAGATGKARRGGGLDLEQEVVLPPGESCGDGPRSSLLVPEKSGNQATPPEASATMPRSVHEMDEEGDDLLGEPPSEKDHRALATDPLPAMKGSITTTAAAPAVIEEHREEREEGESKTGDAEGEEEKGGEQEEGAAEGWASAAADAINKKFDLSF